jgi:hypothetical protein
MLGPRITGLEAPPKEPDLDIEARGDGVCLVGGSVSGKIRHLDCGGDNAFNELRVCAAQRIKGLCNELKRIVNGAEQWTLSTACHSSVAP